MKFKLFKTTTVETGEIEVEFPFYYKYCYEIDSFEEESYYKVINDRTAIKVVLSNVASTDYIFSLGYVDNPWNIARGISDAFDKDKFDYTVITEQEFHKVLDSLKIFYNNIGLKL